MHKQRTVFAGTPEFAVPSLDALIARDDIDLLAVYTQPDRPAGRGRQLTVSPVKRAALAAGLAVCQPETLRDAPAIAEFASLGAELLVVAAYGLMLPTPFIEPPLTAINVHASLLPRWRGAAPIQRALMAGDAETGISIMRVVARLDAGPVWLTRRCPIAAQDTGGSLHDALARLGASALSDALDGMRDRTITESAQDDNAATYARKITHEDRLIDWTRDANALARQVRALAPAPGALARLGRMDVKLLSARAETATSDATPGAMLGHDDDGIAVSTGSGTLRIIELQPAGRQRMSAVAFINGYGAQL